MPKLNFKDYSDNYDELKYEEIKNNRQLKKQKRLEDKNISLELSKSAKDYLIDNGYDEIYGARPLKRFVQRKLETLIAKKILTGEIVPDMKVKIDVKDDELYIK